MARKKKDGAENDNDDDDGGKDSRPSVGNPGADPVGIHRDYVERHLSGGAEPTSDAYTRARRQWQALPGSVNVPPSEVVAEEPPEEPSEEPSEEALPPDEAGQ